MKNKAFKPSYKRFMLLSVLASAWVFFTNVPCAQAGTHGMDAVQQNRTVKGRVFDSTGEPIIGATVKVAGSQTATVTDLDGNYSLSIPPSGKRLQVSYIGFTTQTVTLGNQSTVDVTLVEDNKTLNEVVVVGYGTMRKKDLTGSIVQIRPDKLANENPGTVQDILRGTAGLSVGYNADAKGGGSLLLRGQNSVYDKSSHNAPLIVLDGMAFDGELSEINPDDIGQIDVLKDASAAAIYGSKAASGVIIITTKKGKIGKPTINVSVNFGVNTKSDYRGDVYDAAGYLKYREDWYKTTTYGTNPATGAYEAYQARDKKGNLVAQPGYFDTAENAQALYGVGADAWAAYSKNESGESLASIYGRRLNLEDAVLANYLTGKTVDWADHTFRTGFNQDYNASISGGSENMNYYMSAGFLHNEGAVRGNDYRSIRANMKLSGKVTKWLEVGANVNFQDRSDGDIAVGLGTNYWDSNMLRNSPYADYRYEDGSYAQYPMGKGVKRGYNYDFERQYLDLEKGYQVLNTIFNAKVMLPFGITYSFNAAPRFQYFYNRYFTSASRPDSSPIDRGVDRGWGKTFNWSLNNTINWDYTLAKVHHFVVTLVQEAEEKKYWSDNIKARNILPSDALGFHNTQNATKENSSFSTKDTHQTADALLARLFYSYDDRYMLTASVRRDGYSAFGSSNPYATFPSVALGWSFTNEKWFKWKPMSMGKLRLSWGKNGNRSLEDPYISLANLSSGAGATMGYITKSGTVFDMKYLGADRLANPGLQWEKTSSTNIGLDFGFLNDRITGTLDLYWKQTHDMIMAERLPGFSGFGSITTNLGQVNNNGFELSLNSINIDTKDFTWNTAFTFAYNRNRIKHLYYEYENITDSEGNIIGSKEKNDISNGWFIGQPIGEIWNYKVLGIWQKDQVEEAAKYGQRPGDPIVENSYTGDDIVNADGTVTPVYNDKDKQFLGVKQPPIHWSLRNDFTLWKNLTFSFSIYSYMGHKSLETYYLNNDNGGSMVSYGFNMFTKNYWTPDNPTNTYARLDASGPTGAQGAGRLYNRSFIRFDNFSIAYTIPRQWIASTGIERLKVYFNIKNLGTWKKDWEYGDPETSGLATRTFTFGLNVTL